VLLCNSSVTLDSGLHSRKLVLTFAFSGIVVGGVSEFGEFGTEFGEAKKVGRKRS